MRAEQDVFAVNDGTAQRTPQPTTGGRNDGTANPAPKAIILAAGKGTRMGGDLPKVVYPVAGRPMICWVVDACREAGVEQCVVVIGYKGEQVREALGNTPGCVFVEQTELLGTGHATAMAEPMLAGDEGRDVFVLAGDGPLIRPQTLTALLHRHRTDDASATLASALLDDPSGYGRVLREPDGSYKTIVEQADATPEQLAVREINPSYYCFASGPLFAGLKQINNKNRQGEYYLTDVPALLKSQGHRVSVIDAVPAEDVLSINTPTQLEIVSRVLENRLAAAGKRGDA